MRLAVAAVAGALAAVACGGSSGTISIDLAAAPDSDILERIQRVRLELDNPPAVAEAERSGGGLALDLEVEASNGLGRLSLEAFDAAGDLIAVGASAPVPITSIDGVLTLYLAPPMSIATAPVSFDPPRANNSAAPLSFGAIFAGGLDAAGQPLADMLIYNVYDHEFQVGDDMPAPRSQQAIAVGEAGLVYLFGGFDANRDPSADYLAFDTNTAPAGRYIELDSDPSLARAEPAAYLGNERAVVLGDPPVFLDNSGASAVAGPALAGVIARTDADDLAIAVGAGTASTGAASIRRIDALLVAELPGPDQLQRVDHAAATLPNGDILFAGGSVGGTLESGALRYRAAQDDFVFVGDLLATPRADPAIVATDRYVLVIGGTDASSVVLDSVEVFTAAGLQPVTTLSLAVPRTGASAIALGNGQVLISGGRDFGGAPIGRIELFTPD